MMRALGALALPLLHKLEPETAHRLALAALRFAPTAPPRCDPRLGVAAFGLTFANPLGLAAGFDKNAGVAPGLLGAGFGFIEVGTLTPRPQRGNPRPRLFRLPADAALVNRLGFNNDGYVAAHARLAGRRPAGVVGVNIGPNRDSADRVADYVLGVRTFADVASYFAINVSSPNTPGLRDLQQRDALDGLVARVIGARDGCPVRRPVLVKIAPDVDLVTLDDIVSVCRARGVDGMIVGNTTISRPASLRDSGAAEAGGLSGKPLFELATRTLARTFLRVDGAFGLVGCGGVDGAPAALAKLEAGASLVQLYTALTYRGPGLVPAILLDLAAAMDARGLARLDDLVGAGARDWAVAKS
ncbi:MAG: quinone-dependent dihydroorotate dehydrogenase [Roseiarcus sp.]|jgi:dihydroorotate dehydrogenase